MHDRPYITVVSGLPRSGTSLMMQMLHAGGMPVLADERRGADEDNPRGYLELQRVLQIKNDQSWVAEAVGKAIKIIHMLLQHLPSSYEYRVIMMQRDLEEVVRSQSVMLNRSGKQCASIPADQLAKVFASQMQSVRRWLSEQPNIRVLEVRYADLIQQPETQATLVNEFVGGGLDLKAMASAVDPTLYRQRKSQ